MNRPHRRDHNSVPIGRRVAELRTNRGMSQQAFADRLGKSKSWVDKVERGVRRLDRYSVIRDIADVLRLDPEVLLGPRRPAPATPSVEGVDAVRAALASYHDRPLRTVPAQQASQQVGHAWMSYQHARYPQLLGALPGLLDVTRGPRSLLVSTYRITAAVLVKLDHAELAWLAADRAVTAADGGPTLTAAATIDVTQALRALGHHQLALTAALTAADTTDDHTVRGTLFLQAGLAAASRGDRRNAQDLLDHAAGLAHRLARDTDAQHTAFGRTAVQVARSLAAHHLGNPSEAIERHEHAIRSDGWRRLPPEHRAAHLIDTAHAHLDTGDPTQAGQALLDADSLAPAEVRSRPVARTLLAQIIHRGPAAADIARLATIVGLTRQP
ncbi:helix-turn-helix domain-containing protein [Micromonospora endophytica]|uniref:XRE family transcriptional regulator n=1 Tax=Micromonospora endophytica TaxID=515350 RepID=A0A2W2D1M9_9ACTN|nr:helix-turn-helix domain-containing protein [Micromonospora endophytica]PZF99524.1 XRE family transcriptional regulator [Micromonospora endophytica]RIW40593.1 XRE family transcriptional regulator [Micromonospora endophytica]BCJ59158.1 transcriptional regulator [Micromonospora endophytica]